MQGNTASELWPERTTECSWLGPTQASLNTSFVCVCFALRTYCTRLMFDNRKEEAASTFVHVLFYVRSDFTSFLRVLASLCIRCLPIKSLYFCTERGDTGSWIIIVPFLSLGSLLEDAYLNMIVA